MLANVYAELLKLEGFECTIATSYDEAFDMFNLYGKFNYALIDIVLRSGGEKNGIKLGEAIEKLYPDTEFILISAYAAPPIDPHYKYIDKTSHAEDESFAENLISQAVDIWDK